MGLYTRRLYRSSSPPFWATEEQGWGGLALNLPRRPQISRPKTQTPTSLRLPAALQVTLEIHFHVASAAQETNGPARNHPRPQHRHRHRRTRTQEHSTQTRRPHKPTKNRQHTPTHPHEHTSKYKRTGGRAALRVSQGACERLSVCVVLVEGHLISRHTKFELVTPS